MGDISQIDYVLNLPGFIAAIWMWRLREASISENNILRDRIEKIREQQIADANKFGDFVLMLAQKAASIKAE